MKKRANIIKTAAQKRADSEAWAKMLAKFGGHPGEKLDKKNPAPLKFNLTPVLEFHSERSVADLPSRVSYTPATQAPRKPEYTGVMAMRELEARKESARRKTMIAPIYNKGPAGYIAGYDPKDLGKK